MTEINEINYNNLKVDALQSQINVLESQANTLKVEINKIKRISHQLERNVYKRENPFNVRFTEYIQKHSIHPSKSGDFFEDFFDESEITTVKEILGVYRNCHAIIRSMIHPKNEVMYNSLKEQCLALMPNITKMEEIYSLDLAKTVLIIPPFLMYR